MDTQLRIPGYNTAPLTVVSGALRVLEKHAFDAAKQRLIFIFVGELLNDYTDAERAAALVERARGLGLSDKQSLPGVTLNSWRYEVVPPTWAVKAALSILGDRNWHPPADEPDLHTLVQYLKK